MAVSQERSLGAPAGRCVRSASRRCFGDASRPRAWARCIVQSVPSALGRRRSLRASAAQSNVDSSLGIAQGAGVLHVETPSRPPPARFVRAEPRGPRSIRCVGTPGGQLDCD
eukprot:6172601-Pyramimonas_sp.AAC.1